MIKKVKIAIVLVLVTAGCGSDISTDNDNETKEIGGKGDFSDNIVCDITNKSGRPFDAAQLRDQAMAFGLRGGTCPTDINELIKKIQSSDDCTSDVSTGIISENAMIKEKIEGNTYRLVMAKGCVPDIVGRSEHDRHKLMFSVNDITPKVANPSKDPKDWNIPLMGFKMMALDEENRAYNFYQHVEGDRYEFFGDSKDFVKGEGGTCGECHTSGAGIMIESNEPYLHWYKRGDDRMPGAEEINLTHEAFGFITNPISIEEYVKNSNDAILAQRIETAVLENDIKTLFRPVLCSTEVAIDAFEDFSGAKNKFNLGFDIDIPHNFFMDPFVSNQGEAIEIEQQIYRNAVIASGQFIEGYDRSEGQFDRVRGIDQNDTFYRGAFIQRAPSDNAYTNALSDMFHSSLIFDLLNVDFTQPVFSEGRCSLLELLPTDVDITSLTPEFELGGVNQTVRTEVVAGFKKNLEAASSKNPAAAEMLKIFALSSNDTFDRRRDFKRACEERAEDEPEAFMADIMRVLSYQRNEARKLKTISHPSKLPKDELNETSPIALDPENCKLP